MSTTIVTGIYYSSPFSRMGGRGYTFEYYLAPFRNLLNLGCNIVVYSHLPEIDKINTFFKNYSFKDYKIIEYDLDSYPNSDLIYRLKEKENIINENGLIIGNSPSTNDRNHNLCLMKPFFIENTIKNNFFDSQKYYWIDAGLFHHGIFPETYGGIEKLTKVNEKNYWPVQKNNVCTPFLLDKLEEKNKTGMVFLGIDGYYGIPYYFSTYSKNKPKVTHIIGGLFGGNKDIILHFSKDFSELSTSLLKDGILTLEEEVMSILYTKKYNQYSYISFKSWYHDIPTVPNYFNVNSNTESFYKIFI